MALISYNQLKEVLEDFKTKIQAKFVENITFDDSIDVATNKSKNTLKQTKNNQETVVINHVVEDWGDLEHTKYAKISNIFDKNTQVTNDKKYVIVTNGVGQLHTDPDWKVGRVPCKANDTFTVVKGSKHDSIQMGVYNSNGSWIHGMSVNQTSINGRMVYKVTIPSNLADASYFVFNMHNQSITPDEVMVFEGHLADGDIPKEYYPNLGKYTAVVDGDKVAIEFNKDSTSLQSNTVVEAIKELDGKIVNAGGGTVTGVNGQKPNQQGEVTVGIAHIAGLQGQLDGKVNTSLVGNDANKIPQLSNGKLVDTIIPELAITRIVDVTNQTEALNKANSGHIQVGDSVRLTGERNKVYQYNGSTSGTFFGDRFIEISLGDETVRTVNGEKPALDGNVTINAGQINGTYGGSVGKIQGHFDTIKNSIDSVTSRANGNANRIAILENKLPTVQVGDIIQTFKDSGDSYTVGRVTYLYIGKKTTVTHSTYPDLAPALGINGATRYDLPIINDINVTFDNGTKNRNRKHYIVAKIS